MKDYEIVIGLEIHAEVNTNSKVFSGHILLFETLYDRIRL